MHGWIKHFSDGTSEVGSDRAVRSHRASWTRGRHEGMVSVDLHWNGMLYTLSCGEGEYFQSDTMTALFSPGQKMPGKMQTRRISRQLNENDVGKFISHNRIDSVTIVRLSDEEDSTEIVTSMIGKWLILELTAETGDVRIVIQSARK